MCGESSSSPRLVFSRRTFLHEVGVTLGGAVLAAPGVAAAQECSPTLPDILGPFYRFGAPFQAKLGAADEPGEKLVISGTVYSSDCRTVLSSALIEVWQANSAGRYDTDIPGHFTEATSFHLRGMLNTDERGRYEIETVMPGRYPIGPGLPGAGQTRPAHIHFRVMEALHIPLTTQLYFQGDPFIGKDPFASRKPSLAIKLKQDARHLRGVFDIVLATGT
jgi:catechol 1,2-dioxygenase